MERPPDEQSRILTSISKGLSYLARVQRDDGCWESYRFETAALEEGSVEPLPFPTAFIAYLLSGSTMERSASEMVKRAQQCLDRQQEAAGYVTVDGAARPLGQKHNCYIVPDLDTNAFWHLATNRPSSTVFLRLLDATPEEGGLYATYVDMQAAEFDVPEGARICPVDYRNNPSIGVNVNVAVLLARSGEVDRARNILDAMDQWLSEPRQANEWVYYRSIPLMRYLLRRGLADHLSTSTINEVDRAMANHSNDWMPAGSENLSDAAEILLRAYGPAVMCSADTDALVNRLVSEQKPSGAFALEPVYEANDGWYYGSEAETTAAVVAALVTYLDACSERSD